jgi:hypothetical protein
MSQQLMQQEWIYQFRPGTNTHQARSSRKGKSSPTSPWHNLRTRIHLHLSPATFTLAAMGLTAFLLALAILYLSANALAAKTEYQRQRLQRETTLLRERNAALRCQLGQAANLARVSQFALAAGMRPADPAAESDFLRFTPAQSRAQAGTQTWFDSGPVLVAALARQMGSPFVSGRAEASQTEPRARRR